MMGRLLVVLGLVLCVTIGIQIEWRNVRHDPAVVSMRGTNQTTFLDCHGDLTCLAMVDRWKENQARLRKDVDQARVLALERVKRGAPEYYEGLDELSQGGTRKPPKFQSIADYNIVGAAKAGTSQLYRILAGHADVQPWHRDKEHCFSRGLDLATLSPEDLRFELLRFHRTEYRKHTNVTKQTVNGCIWFHDITLTWQYLQPRQAKYLYLFRDPAEWLWAVWNFWQQDSMDIVYRGGGWADADQHYRSPELFHEFVVSRGKTRGGQTLLRNLDELTRNAIRLKHMAGEKALFLKNEDMLPDQVERGLLDRLSEFSGLNRSAFDPKTYQSISNCNSDKGVDHSGCGSHKSSAYPIAGGREMLPETRTILYLRSLEECKLWSREFGIEYPSCLNVLEE